MWRSVGGRSRAIPSHVASDSDNIWAVSSRRSNWFRRCIPLPLYSRDIAGTFYFNGDTLLDSFTGGWASIIGTKGIASVVAGLLCGYLATVACSKITKRADFNVVAYANATLVVVFTAIAVVAGILKSNFSSDLFAVVANTAGVCLGLYFAAQHIREQQAGKRTPDKLTADMSSNVEGANE